VRLSLGAQHELSVGLGNFFTRSRLSAAVRVCFGRAVLGYSQGDLVHVMRVVAKQEWSTGKGLGSLLSFKVVDANRPKPLVKAEANLSPRAASILARVRERRPIREAG